MKPFEDDATSISLGDLSIENGLDTIVVHGSLEIGRTKEGLDLAKRLQGRIADIVSALEAMDLSSPRTAQASPSRTVHSPFRKG